MRASWSALEFPVGKVTAAGSSGLLTALPAATFSFSAFMNVSRSGGHVHGILTPLTPSQSPVPSRAMSIRRRKKKSICKKWRTCWVYASLDAKLGNESRIHVPLEWDCKDRRCRNERNRKSSDCELHDL